MPFGHDCEFATFADCVQAQRAKGHTEDEARRICGRLQADTEAKCAQQLYMPRSRGRR